MSPAPVPSKAIPADDVKTLLSARYMDITRSGKIAASRIFGSQLPKKPSQWSTVNWACLCVAGYLSPFVPDKIASLPTVSLASMYP